MQTNNKLRDALERIASFPMPPPIELAQQAAVEMRDVAIAALAEPVRNCEVGTAEEQENRFDAFCKGINGCRDCIIYIRGQNDYCHSAWSQMPYKEGDAK